MPRGGFLFFDATQMVTIGQQLVEIMGEECLSIRKAGAKIGQAGVKRQKALITHGSFTSLSEAHAERKRKAGKGRMPILVWDGDMRDSITYNVESDTLVTIGPTDSKAPYHTSDLPRSVMPLRDFVSLGGDFSDEAATVFADEVVRQIDMRLP